MINNEISAHFLSPSKNVYKSPASALPLIAPLGAARVEALRFIETLITLLFIYLETFFR